MQSPYPFWEQLLGLAIVAPVIGIVFGVLALGWARTVQGGTVSKKAIESLRKQVLAMIGAIWLVGFGEVILVHFFPGIIPWIQRATS